jgi:hypothetical protein
LLEKVKHNVVIHNIIYYDDDSTKDDDVYDMSAPVSVILAHSTDCWTKSANKCGKSYVWMQHAKWFSLDDNREFWDQRDNKAKSIILGYETNGYGPSLIASSPGTKFGPFKQKANLHDVFIQTYSCELKDPEVYEQEDTLNQSC